MFSNWQLTTISFIYIGLLFVIAFVGDKYRHKIRSRQQAFIYALTLGVYCTSWSFLGTVGQASTNLLSYLPIYLGPILLFLFAWSFVQRLIHVSVKLNLTSIADLLAARYGNSRRLATLVTLVALIGILPYIALQLKAIVHSFQLLATADSISTWQTGLLVSLVLAGFIVLFGIRNIDITERHPGIMLAIAFESLIKLSAFLLVGIVTCFVIFDSPLQIFEQTQAADILQTQWVLPNLLSVVGLTVISMAAFLCLPRQFHVMVVELKHVEHSQLSRKLFPAYILIFALFSAPLGLAGHVLLSGQVPSDAYVLFLPSEAGQHWLTLFAFLGAISAGSSMVIVSSIALSTMLSNEVVFPLLFKQNNTQDVDYHGFRSTLLSIRRLLVLFIILLGYSMFLLAPPNTLASLGEVSFGAIAQLAPGLIAAFYFRTAALSGVYSGISVGFFLWVVLSFLPQFNVLPSLFEHGWLEKDTASALFCLLANVLTLWIVSYFSRPSVQERVQIKHFFPVTEQNQTPNRRRRVMPASELELLVSRFVGVEKAKQSFAQFYAEHPQGHVPINQYHDKLLQHTTSTLASVMGASSAQLVISSALEGRDIGLDDVATFVEDASSQRHSFSRDLLQSAIENVNEGISVIDTDLNLVAWNRKYEEMFEYPAELLVSGCPIEQLIRFNVRRGLCGPGDIEQQVAKRLAHLRNRSPHSSERQYQNGKSIRIEGNPLPSGGFVMLFTDITAYRQAEQVLRDTNLDLETLVSERTDKLEQANRELALAHARAEDANLKKSQYLHACSHDLMQPLEAARLFTSALDEQAGLNAQQTRLVQQVQHSLKIANDLLSDLGEIARIEGGHLTTNVSEFALQDIFTSLNNEFAAAASEYQVEFHIINTQLWIRSDRNLLHRVLQNLIGNAFRYASPGRVLLGARRRGKHIELRVIDNGPGIPKAKQQQVFQQFVQLDHNTAGQKRTDNKTVNQGLGLGLNISRNLCLLLGHQLTLRSTEGKGCQFAIQCRRAETQQLAPQRFKPLNSLQGVKVLCIDNDPDVLDGMFALLSAWQCEVYTATSIATALSCLHDNNDVMDIALVDYQLDNQENGLDLIQQVREQLGRQLPAILITANTDNHIMQRAKALNIGYLRKLIKPGALRALISAKLTQALQKNYSEASPNDEFDNPS